MACGTIASILMMGCVVGPVLSQGIQPTITLAAGPPQVIHARPPPAPAPAPAPVPRPPPNKCRGGFSVRKGDTSSLKTGQKVKFQDVLTNMGGWSASANEFIVPCAGVYFFTFHAISIEDGDFTLALMKNQDYQVTAYGSNASYQQGSNSALLILSQGDRVYLELQQGSLYEHPYNEAYTTFSGFLIEAF